MRATLYFDADYTGTRYTYGLTYRPIGKGQVPDGWIIGSDRKHPTYAHGTVDYPAPLAPAQLDAFQLAFLGSRR